MADASMVAGAPQWLAATARGQPPGRGQKQKDLFVGAPGHGTGDLLRDGRGMAGDGARYGEVGPGGRTLIG